MVALAALALVARALATEIPGLEMVTDAFETCVLRVSVNMPAWGVIVDLSFWPVALLIVIARPRTFADLAKLKPRGSDTETVVIKGAFPPAATVNRSLALRAGTPVSEPPEIVGLATDAAGGDTGMVGVVTGLVVVATGVVVVVVVVVGVVTLVTGPTGADVAGVVPTPLPAFTTTWIFAPAWAAVSVSELPVAPAMATHDAVHCCHS